MHSVENTPRLVGGVTAACAAAAKSLCSTFAPVVEVRSPEIAEAAKLLENSFRAVNLAFVNEFARGCRAMGLDVRQVVDAAATLPHGFMRFDPGPGVGGHCIPVDPHYWVAAVRRAGVDAPLLALSQAINAEVPSWVGAEVEERLAGQGKSLVGAEILLSGVAYKRGVADVRNSPAEGLLAFLEARGAVVSFDDPPRVHVEGPVPRAGAPYWRWPVGRHLEVDHRGPGAPRPDAARRGFQPLEGRRAPLPGCPPLRGRRPGLAPSRGSRSPASVARDADPRRVEHVDQASRRMASA